jgi:hypothetical protein
MAKQENIVRTGKNLSSKKSLKAVIWQNPIQLKNLIWLGVGLVIIIVGYLLMATSISNEPALITGKPWNNIWAIDIAPVILTIGYCILIPLAIYKIFGPKKEA